jgi:hypothetical protein
VRKINILKEAVVLLIAVALILPTAVAANTLKINNEVQMDPSCLKTSNSNPSIPYVEPLFGPILFKQRPYEPSESWSFFTSASGAPHICADDFWEIQNEICDIHWWGLSLLYNGGWYSCDPEGMVFEIIFYQDAGGVPGAVVCQYQVSPPAIPTGKLYSGFEMYYWETVLEPCCNLPNGWVSIQSISSPNGCWFLWAGSPDGNKNALQDWAPISPENNLAFELTGKLICKPGIDVKKYVKDRSGKWQDADTENEAVDLPICTNITFKIVITNTGDCPLIVSVDDKMHDSLKYTRADPKPDEVNYDPPFYYLKWVLTTYILPNQTVEIVLIAHVEGPECSIDFNFVHVKGVTENQEIIEDEDYAYVHAIKKDKSLNLPIINFLQSYTNLFQILQKLLKLGL